MKRKGGKEKIGKTKKSHALWNPFNEGEPDWKSNKSRSKSPVAASRTDT
jgi:hypothetical protein